MLASNVFPYYTGPYLRRKGYRLIREGRTVNLWVHRDDPSNTLCVPTNQPPGFDFVMAKAIEMWGKDAGEIYRLAEEAVQGNKES